MSDFYMSTLAQLSLQFNFPPGDIGNNVMLFEIYWNGMPVCTSLKLRAWQLYRYIVTSVTFVYATT